MAGLHRGLWKAQRALSWASFVVAVVWSAGLSWASPSADLSRAARRLGSTAFSERHEAGDVLLKAGPSAIPYLREAATSDIPEIRFRALGILERIELQVLDGQKAEILSGSLPEGQFPAWDCYL